ncbi:hypothetical protein [Streptococcus suis]|uniref:hypothetical protein n=2 Tax=Streptococcus suis TaxID=1307 RepID=UPI000C17CF44|nr:hypothetical protein [Streptococcus suis]
MKKTFVTLATVAALVAATAPVATTFANNNSAFNTSSKVDAKAAQIGRDYQIQLGKVELAQAAAAAAAETLANKTNDLIASEEAVRAGEAQVKTANKTAEILLQQAKQQSYSTPEEASQKLVEADEQGKALVAQAKSTLEEAKTNLEYTQGVVAELKKDADAKHAVLLEEQAKLAQLEQAWLNAGGNPENPGNAAPAADAAANGNGSAADAAANGNGKAADAAANGNGKAAAKTVAAAKTETGAKTLPKTSAAK